MSDFQIILALVIVGLSIVMPMYYSYKIKKEKQKIEDQIKESKYVTEKEKIRVYIDKLNEETRSKYRS